MKKKLQIIFPTYSYLESILPFMIDDVPDIGIHQLPTLTHSLSLSLSSQNEWKNLTKKYRSHLIRLSKSLGY